MKGWKLSERVLEASTKLCPKCKGEPQLLTEFTKCADRKDGLSCYCKTCTRAYSDDWYRRNWTKRRAQMDAYKVAHPEKAREYRRRRWQRNGEKEYAAHRAWVKANPERRRAHDRNRRNYDERLAFKRTWEKQKIAIETGQSSPIFKFTGFALVSDGNKWRAARLGVPWGRTEFAYVYYRFELGRWLIYAPPIRTPDPNLIRRLRMRESRKHRAGKPLKEAA